MRKYYLASGSPRRKELLSSILPKFEVLVPSFEEDQPEGESPAGYVERMARGKAQAFWSEFSSKLSDKDIFITADTIVSKGQKVFGKPKDFDDAHAILASLSGSTHEVTTAVCIAEVKGESVNIDSFNTVTKVYFRELSEDELSSYLKTDEPWDKAGAYGIQGRAGVFVDKIEGSYHNVVGLPLSQVMQKLKKIIKNQ